VDVVKSLLPRGTCAGCREIVEYLPGGRPAPHTIEVYSSADKAAADVPCPGNDHPIAEMPPEGFGGICQHVRPLAWTRLSGSGDPGVEVFLMLDGRICTRVAVVPT
jgi:hypothetical protein